jgi:dienelactone hydrolase
MSANFARLVASAICNVRLGRGEWWGGSIATLRFLNLRPFDQLRRDARRLQPDLDVQSLHRALASRRSRCRFDRVPNASHAFDNPLGAQPAAVSPTFQSARNCKVREEADGLLINVETNQPFTYKDTCVELSPHLGYDPNATRAAKTTVKAFLRTVFKLN